MGVATRLGSFAFFVALWVSMMAAVLRAISLDNNNPRFPGI
jgi:hypothetical protein